MAHIVIVRVFTFLYLSLNLCSLFEKKQHVYPSKTLMSTYTVNFNVAGDTSVFQCRLPVRALYLSPMQS